MIKDELKNIKTGAKELRNFGFVVGGIFFAIGVIFFLKSGAGYGILLVVGTVLAVLGILFPRALYFPYRTWMGFAVIMGWIMSRVILAILFFVVITIIGLIARMAGKDFLGLKRKAGASSYWHKREGALLKEQYEKQF